MDDMRIIDLAGMLDQRIDKMLGLGAAGADEDTVAGLNEFHRHRGALYFILISLFPIKFLHNYVSF